MLDKDIAALLHFYPVHRRYTISDEGMQDDVVVLVAIIQFMNHIASETFRASGSPIQRFRFKAMTHDDVEYINWIVRHKGSSFPKKIVERAGLLRDLMTIKWVKFEVPMSYPIITEPEDLKQ